MAAASADTAATPRALVGAGRAGKASWGSLLTPPLWRWVTRWSSTTRVGHPEWLPRRPARDHEHVCMSPRAHRDHPCVSDALAYRAVCGGDAQKLCSLPTTSAHVHVALPRQSHRAPLH